MEDEKTNTPSPVEPEMTEEAALGEVAELSKEENEGGEVDGLTGEEKV